MTGAPPLPDMLAFPLAQAVEELEGAGWVVELVGTAPLSYPPPDQTRGRVARVQVIGDRVVRVTYVEEPQRGL